MHERVLAVVEEVLAHRRAGERRHPLDRRRLLRGRGDDDRVLHRALVAQPLVHLRDRRGLLADGDVDADHVAAALVEDRVDRDRGLAGAAVADDQLALAAADRWIIESIALIPVCSGSLTGWRWTTPGALNSSGRARRRLDRALAVERVAERVDDAAEQAFADRHGHDLARCGARARLP